MQIVRGTGNGLDVTIAVPVDDASLYTLLGLLARYGVVSTPLRVLCNRENERWFKNPEKYWFTSVFKEDG